MFAFFQAMAENYLHWHPDHLAFRWLSTEGLRTGATATFVERIGGTTMTKRVAFVRVEPGQYLAMAPTNRAIRLVLPRMSFAIEPTEGGSRLTAEIVVRTGPIGAWLNRREFDAVRGHMREEGENLRRLVEQDPSARAVARRAEPRAG